MTTINARVLACTRGPTGQTLTTLQLRYPRFVHSEIMTHRCFSRNASSSRAIPVKRQIADMMADPAEPVEWGSNKPGMQAGADLSAWRKGAARFAWHGARYGAALGAYVAASVGAHKQIANRLIEPWAHIDVILSSTEWRNFFKLRCHPDADPTMRALAQAIRVAVSNATPVDFADHRNAVWGWVHLPLVDVDAIPRPLVEQDPEAPAFISAARCARVSYGNRRNDAHSPTEDYWLGQRLLEAGHMSPFEHIARPDIFVQKSDRFEWGEGRLHNNFNGFVQFRGVLDDRMEYEAAA